jgi:hypothetical protein
VTLAAAGLSAIALVSGVHLSWVRGDAAADCPDAAAVEAEVAARLGENPFARAPTQFIEAAVDRRNDTFEVSIAMRGADGKRIGNRSLASNAPDCRSIATAAALTIAILIDPDALLRAAPPPPPPPPPPPRVASAAATREARLTASGAAAWGALPGTAFGVELGATVDVTRRAAVGVLGGFFPDRRTAPPDDGFAFGLSTIEGLGCFIALREGPADLRAELCLGLAAGLLDVVVYAPMPVSPGERWTFAAAQLARATIPIFRSGMLELGVEATEPFPRRSFFVEGRPAGMDTVFTQPTWGVKGLVGLGLRWR